MLFFDIYKSNSDLISTHMYVVFMHVSYPTHLLLLLHIDSASTFHPIRIHHPSTINTHTHTNTHTRTLVYISTHFRIFMLPRCTRTSFWVRRNQQPSRARALCNCAGSRWLQYWLSLCRAALVPCRSLPPMCV